MNKIVNKFSLAGDTFMPEMHLKQPGLLIVLVLHLLKKRKNWNIYKNWKSNCIYINDLNKACFQHNMVYGRSKDLARRTESDKVLRDKAFEIASNPKYDGYQRRLASMVSCFMIKNLPQVVSLHQIINLQMNFISSSLEDLREESLFFI